MNEGEKEKQRLFFELREYWKSTANALLLQPKYLLSKVFCFLQCASCWSWWTIDDDTPLSIKSFCVYIFLRLITFNWLIEMYVTLFLDVVVITRHLTHTDWTGWLSKVQLRYSKMRCRSNNGLQLYLDSIPESKSKNLGWGNWEEGRWFY